MIFNEISKVISNREIAENIFEAILSSPNISKKSQAGQFINILPSKNWGKIMRRPMSIASQKNGNISIIYKVFGEGTKIMSKWKQNDQIDIIGPLGNSWTNFENKTPVLIGGGVGIAPIINLHNMLCKKSIQHILIMGAKTKEEHFMNHDVDNHILLCTDKGGLGIKGNILIPLYEIIKNIDIDDIKIFTCGPPGMMKAVTRFSIEKHIDCDLALETIMACGVGICQGCTIVKKCTNQNHSYRSKYALACIDGPIFNIKDLEYDCI